MKEGKTKETFIVVYIIYLAISQIMAAYFLCETWKKGDFYWYSFFIWELKGLLWPFFFPGFDLIVACFIDVFELIVNILKIILNFIKGLFK